MKIKFAGKWYDVLEVRESAGIERYKIEDEPNHFDWIGNPDELMLEEE